MFCAWLGLGWGGLGWGGAVSAGVGLCWGWVGSKPSQSRAKASAEAKATANARANARAEPGRAKPKQRKLGQRKAEPDQDTVKQKLAETSHENKRVSAPTGNKFKSLNLFPVGAPTRLFPWFWGPPGPPLARDSFRARFDLNCIRNWPVLGGGRVEKVQGSVGAWSGRGWRGGWRGRTNDA